jgi:hypothetical protein
VEVAGSGKELKVNVDNLGGSFERKPTDEAHRQLLDRKMSDFVAMLKAKYAGIEVEEEEVGEEEEEGGTTEGQNSLQAAVEDPSDEEA